MKPEEYDLERLTSADFGIKLNRWYRFSTQADKRHFLRVVTTVLSQFGIIPVQEVNTDELLDKEMLMFSVEPVRIKYRTTYDTRYCPNYLMYVPLDNVVNYSVCISTKPAKEGIKMELIHNHKQQELQVVSNEVEEGTLHILRSNPKTGVLLAHMEALEKVGITTVDKDYAIAVLCELLSPADKEKLTELHNQAVKTASSIEARYFELTQLYGITTTYDQKLALLQTYGIISKKVQ